MKKLKWWFLAVGVFYALLATMNMYFVLFNPAGISANFDYPFSTSGNEVMAFVDGWAAFAFEILGIATFLLWASRNPRRYVGAVWALVWLEFTHGVLDDAYLIARGYDAGFYIGFIVVHLIIIATGVISARAAETEIALS